MLIKIFIKYIIGYVRVVAEGYYIERFINICKNNNILIWNLKREKNIRLFLNIGIKDFKKLSSICKKTKCRIKIESKHGIPFLLNKYRKRKIFAILLVIVAISIYFSSNYIWNIEVREENGIELENILEDINEAGLSVGKQKNKVDIKSVIDKLRFKRDDLAWAGIELKGTNAIVKLVKADKAPEIIDENDYCNVVANKSGLITKINAQNGTAMVKEGDVVRQGSILIQGIMEGKYTEPRYVHASGEIQAKVWYTKSRKIYYKQEENAQTGNIIKNLGIKIKNFKIFFPKSLSKFELYDTIEKEKKVKLFSNLYLPISVIEIEYKETKKVQKKYSIEEAAEIGKHELEQELENEISNKDNILRKKYKHIPKRGICRGIYDI